MLSHHIAGSSDFTNDKSEQIISQLNTLSKLWKELVVYNGTLLLVTHGFGGNITIQSLWNFTIPRGIESQPHDQQNTKLPSGVDLGFITANLRKFQWSTFTILPENGGYVINARGIKIDGTMPRSSIVGNSIERGEVITPSEIASQNGRDLFFDKLTTTNNTFAFAAIQAIQAITPSYVAVTPEMVSKFPDAILSSLSKALISPAIAQGDSEFSSTTGTVQQWTTVWTDAILSNITCPDRDSSNITSWASCTTQDTKRLTAVLWSLMSNYLVWKSGNGNVEASVVNTGRLGTGGRVLISWGSDTQQYAFSMLYTPDQIQLFLAAGFKVGPKTTISVWVVGAQQDVQKALGLQEKTVDEHLRGMKGFVRVDMKNIGPMTDLALAYLYGKVGDAILYEKTATSFITRIEDLPQVMNTVNDYYTQRVTDKVSGQTFQELRAHGSFYVWDNGVLTITLWHTQRDTIYGQKSNTSGWVGYTHYYNNSGRVSLKLDGQDNWSYGLQAEWAMKLDENTAVVARVSANHTTISWSSPIDDVRGEIGISYAFGGTNSFVRPSRWGELDFTSVFRGIARNPQYAEFNDMAQYVDRHTEWGPSTYVGTARIAQSIKEPLAVKDFQATLLDDGSVRITFTEPQWQIPGVQYFCSFASDGQTTGNIPCTNGGIIPKYQLVWEWDMTATIFASNIVPNSANSGNKIPTEDSRRTRNGPLTECKVSRIKNAPLQTSATITGPDTLVAGVNQSQQFSLDSVSDANGIDSVTVTFNGQPVPVSAKEKYTTIIPGSRFSQAGSYTLVFTVVGKDGKWNPDTANKKIITKTITVTPPVVVSNQAPVAFGTIAPISLTAGVAGSTILPVTTDPNGDPLNYSVSSLPSGFSFDPSTRTLSWTASVIPRDYPNIVYKADDGKGGIVTTALSLVVASPVLSAPTAISLSGTATLTQWSLTVGQQIATLSCAQAEGKPCTYTSTLNPDFEISGNTLRIKNAGLLAGTYTVPVTATVTNEYGVTKAYTQNVSVTVEAPAIVPLNLTINRPVLGDIGSSTLFYDQTLPEFDGSWKRIIYSDVQYVSHTGAIERIMPASLINNVVRFTNVDVYGSEEVPIIKFTYRVTGVVTGIWAPVTITIIIPLEDQWG